MALFRISVPARSTSSTYPRCYGSLEQQKERRSQMIHDLLPVGQENAVPRNLLVSATGLSERALRKQVERERLSGVPILTDTERGGYYLPSCPAETGLFAKQSGGNNMRENKNARPAGGTAGQATENNAGRKILHNDYITGAYPISRLLLHGRENAVSLRHLVSMTNLDGRTVRSMITAERFDGVPILSDNSTGYYLPANDTEKTQFIRSMKHRAKEIERVAEAIEKAGR